MQTMATVDDSRKHIQAGGGQGSRGTLQSRWHAKQASVLARLGVWLGQWPNGCVAALLVVLVMGALSLGLLEAVMETR